MKPLRMFALLGAVTLWMTTACKEDEAVAHKTKATQFEKKSQWKEAAEEFALSLTVNPKQEEVIEHLANAHMQLQDFDQVVASMGKLAELKPDPAAKAEVYRNLGGAFVERGMHDRAEPVFLKAVEIDPKDDQSLSWLAEIYAVRGGARDVTAEADPQALDKSVAYLDKVLALKPDDAGTYVNKRIALMKYTEYYKNEKASAEATAAAEKDKARKKELLAKVEEPQAQIDKLTKQVEEISKKITDLTKGAKAE